MRRFRVLFATLAALGFIVACRPAGSQLATRAAHLAPPSAPGSADLPARLEKLAADAGIPGMSVLVLRDGKMVASAVAGVRKFGSPERIGPDDRFHVGSNTKSMTATLAAMFVESGKLKWTTTLGEFFGPGMTGMNPAWRNVTLQQVLAHRAGLPRDTGVFDKQLDLRATPPAQRLQLARAALQRAPEYPPGSKLVYSNVGYIIVGAMLEQIAGGAWEDLMRDRLFGPLGITTGGFGAPGTPGKIDQPWGHFATGESSQGDNYPIVGPAGTVHLSLPDWSQYVLLHLRGDPLNPHHQDRLLKSETFAWLHTPAAGENYLAGWVLEGRPETKGNRPGDTGKVIWHNGSNGRWYCLMVLAPEIDCAVLVGANRAGPGATRTVDEAARTLLKEFAAAPRL